jgi:single-strand DNA-binding protein
MYNKIILMGNLTRDPELKYTPQGTPVTSFRIAVKSLLTREKQENLFIDIIAFGRVAETSNEYLTLISVA